MPIYAYWRPVSLRVAYPRLSKPEYDRYEYQRVCYILKHKRGNQRLSPLTHTAHAYTIYLDGDADDVVRRLPFTAPRPFKGNKYSFA